MNLGQLGWLLVVLQFVLIGGLLVLIAAHPFIGHTLQWVAGALFVLCLLLFGTTLRHNRLGNWQVHPAPLADARLVRSGPYHWIRHPMYAAVLGCAMAAVFWTLQPYAVLLAVALTFVMIGKILLEERLLATHHQNWSEYRDKTARLIPRIW
jgi:protein-S-isoprenylcysteine O-methyltransferase Ste14